MKAKIKRFVFYFISRTIAVLLLLAGYVLARTKYGRELSKHLSFLHAEKTMDAYFFLSLRCVINRGRKGVSFYQYSTPVFSGCNSWAESTYDAAYLEKWSIGKEKDLKKLSFNERLLYFSANIAKQKGYFPLSWALLSLLIEKNDTSKYLGYLGQLDICLLFLCWSNQLIYFYEKDLWFNPEESTRFKDDLSWFFESCNEDKLSELISRIKKVKLDSSVLEQILGEYYERNKRFR